MTIPNHEPVFPQGIVRERIEHLPIGGKMKDIPERLWHPSYLRTGAKKTGGPNLRLYRLCDEPSLTVTGYIFNKFVHPFEDRYLTAREAAVLQSFPNEWEFSGTKTQVHRQIGNAVPVKLGSAIAGSIGRFLNESFEMHKSAVVASYFTGAGGLDLGFELAETAMAFETKFSTDYEVWSRDTITRNRPGWNFVLKDIRELKGAEVEGALGCTPDVIIGGPPCQPFSVAGKQKATDSPLGVLYADFIRHVDHLQPKVVVMENVYGLAQVKRVNMIELIRASFEAIGYEVTWTELNSADFGVPQRRRRMFFVAAKDIANYRFPSPTHCMPGAAMKFSATNIEVEPWVGAISALREAGLCQSNVMA
jgi:DNA (cytosine-5)-methyltransferase 1